jgi:hypothetical protein
MTPEQLLCIIANEYICKRVLKDSPEPFPSTDDDSGIFRYSLYAGRRKTGDKGVKIVYRNHLLLGYIDLHTKEHELSLTNYKTQKRTLINLANTSKKQLHSEFYEIFGEVYKYHKTVLDERERHE